MALVLIGVIGFALYFKSLGGGFLWDDRFLVVENPLIRAWRQIPQLFLHPLTPDFHNVYRPLVNFSFMIGYALGNLNPWVHHLGSLLLHLVNAGLVYGVSLLLSKKRSFALSVGLLFVAHPVLTEPVNYISSRADLLAGCFVLLGFGLYVRHRQTWSRAAYAGALLSFACGLLSKEFVVVFPLLIMVYELTLRPPTPNGSQRGEWFRLLWPFFLILGIWLALRFWILQFEPSSRWMPAQTMAQLPLGQRFFTSLSVVPTTVRLLLLPLGLRKVWVVQPIESMGQLQVIGSGLLVMGLGILAFWIRKRSPLAAFGILWFLVLLLPHLNVVPLNAFMSEGWLYLSTVGFVLLLGVGLFRFVSNPSLRWGILIAVLGVYASLTVGRTQVWASGPERFYLATLQVAPTADRIHVELGSVYLGRGDLEKAQAAYQEALRIHPDNVSARYNLGKVFFKQGRLLEAERSLQEAIARHPRFSMAYNELGLVYRAQGKFEQALDRFKHSQELTPDRYEPYYNMGLVRLGRRNWRKAAEAFQKALHLQPHYAPAAMGLGISYKELDQRQEAVAALTTAQGLFRKQKREDRVQEIERILRHLQGQVGP